MFPLGDENEGITTPPVVTYTVIAANILVFILLQGMGTNEHFTYALSTVPQEVLTGKDIHGAVQIVDPTTHHAVGSINLEKTPLSVYITLLTSMFMHSGWAHLLGNMWFLWIFGDNLEHVMGHFRFLTFYLICGLSAALAQIFATSAFAMNPYIPILGASGAISGVMGGYILLFPHQRVRVIIMRIITTVPAFVALGIWIAFQFISGLGMLGDEAQTGGVAYAAHIGGFVAGLVLVTLFATEHPPTRRSY